jgi:hypothetical protein
MRRLVDRDRLEQFVRGAGAAAAHPTRLYLVGGATAVMVGWRASTVDVDIHLVPEDDALFRAIPRLKEELEINVELACPAHFIPELSGWESRSPFLFTAGKVTCYHYDFYAQALAKLERAHALDLTDVRAMAARKLVTAAGLLRYFAEIEPGLYRFPAIAPDRFRAATESMVAELRKPERPEPATG